ncbi:hypothetical protein G210_5018 [Candida maltosa Xu316]|uniref:Uncharacterized protein n=1 Tax=Candida maltosa (strain Xu316) TaxID=1245528 RepID=M3ITR3_CANMX|nr:hypothetical protein G210_5018 [Candida maltosa Xu316]
MFENFEVPIVYYEENFTLEPVFRQMPYLQKLLATETTIPNLKDLQVLILLTWSFLSRITTFENLTQYENLWSLLLSDCEFPVEAFQDASTFPNMFRFDYLDGVRPWITTDHLVCSKNLLIWQLRGKITIEKWTLLKSLRRLELGGIDVGDNFEFDFPSGVYHLEIINTHLQSMIDVIFPS